MDIVQAGQRVLQETDVFAEYVDQMKKIYTIDVNTISTLGQVMMAINIVISVATLSLLIYWIFKVYLYLAACRHGKAHFADMEYWKRMGAVGLILFLITSGSVYVLFTQLYDVAMGSGWTA